jgi:hypothetical protein
MIILNSTVILKVTSQLRPDTRRILSIFYFIMGVLFFLFFFFFFFFFLIPVYLLTDLINKNILFVFYPITNEDEACILCFPIIPSHSHPWVLMANALIVAKASLRWGSSLVPGCRLTAKPYKRQQVIQTKNP